MGENAKTLGSVLVVEDEQDYAALLATMLRNGGYEVRVAHDGIEALEKVEEHVPDLITLDIQMPRKSGIMFFREIKAKPRLRDVPLLVVTGLTVDDRDMETFIHSFLDVEHLPRPEAYLEKPVEADELVAVVGQAIQSRVHADTTRRPAAKDTAYALARELPSLPYDDAVTRVTQLLADEGFGVLTEIDVRATLKKKLGLTFPRYVILGACNPELAHRALSSEPLIGVLLPCNVMVTERPDDGSIVAAFNPAAAFALVDNPELLPISEEVLARLRDVLDRLAS
jgi:CheY-like chemotaxis protein/uncharacterized protein (DUF302 family)